MIQHTTGRSKGNNIKHQRVFQSPSGRYTDFFFFSIKIHKASGLKKKKIKKKEKKKKKRKKKKIKKKKKKKKKRKKKAH